MSKVEYQKANGPYLLQVRGLEKEIVLKNLKVSSGEFLFESSLGEFDFKFSSESP